MTCTLVIAVCLVILAVSILLTVGRVLYTLEFTGLDFFLIVLAIVSSIALVSVTTLALSGVIS